MDPSLPVYRAPMRSRSDAVDHDAAVRWALEHQIVGVGARPDDRSTSAHAAAQRIDRRARRFAAVPTGCFVWTLASQVGVRLGQVAGPSHEERSTAALQHDLVEIRACRWVDHEIAVTLIPAGVLVAFDRGGRNFQQIHAPGVEGQTAALWQRLFT